MSVTPFPARLSLRRIEIDDPADIAVLEGVVSALAGAALATGGVAALAGRDLHALSLAERAGLLTAMYDAGEVVMGWRDARDGSTVNLVIERLAAGAEAVVWRAEAFVERRDAPPPGGPVLRGALADRRADGLARRLVAAAARGFADPLPSPTAAVAAALRA